METKRDCHFAMRIPKEVVEALKRAATADGRSASNYAVRVLAQHLKGLESAV